MNYAHFHTWVLERVEDLVQMGVPRDAANEAMRYVEMAAINAETEVRKEDQLLLDFKALGGVVLAMRHGVSERAIRKRREKILRKRSRHQSGNPASA
jgi:hypothetical protein